MWSCSYSTFRSATTGLTFAITHHCLCQLHKVWLLVGMRCGPRNWDNLCERYWYVLIVYYMYLWTPKPWKMKVLSPKIWVVTLKNESFWFPWYRVNQNLLGYSYSVFSSQYWSLYDLLAKYWLYQKSRLKKHWHGTWLLPGKIAWPKRRPFIFSHLICSTKMCVCLGKLYMTLRCKGSFSCMFL